MAEFFANVWDSIVKFFLSYNWFTDTLDIVLVAFALYSVIKLVRDSRAEQLLKGFCFLASPMARPSFTADTLKYLLKIIFDNALIVLVVIFQPEIRRALEQAGHSRLGQAEHLRHKRRGERTVYPPLADRHLRGLRGGGSPPAPENGGSDHL